ncbi:MAG: MarR family transcriptional regulator [Thermomicrobiales bacterium]
MDGERQGLVERLIAVTDRMAAHSRKAAMEGWSDIELTMPQLRALGFLAHAPRRMGDLAAYLGSSVSSTTSLVERLEGKALAERMHDPTDRRVVMCALTVQGQELMDRFWRMQRLRLEAVADILTTDELAQVIAAMELMEAALARDAARQEPAMRGDALAARA